MEVESVKVNLSEILDRYSRAVRISASKVEKIPYSEFRNLVSIAKHPAVYLYYTDDQNVSIMYFTSDYKYDDTLRLDASYNEFRKFLLLIKDDIIRTNYQEEKESNKMNIPAMNFDFGPITNDNIRLSPYGLAVKNKEQWLTYNAASGQTIDVTGFTFDFGKVIYKVPVAVKDIKVNDMVLHQGRPVYVTGVAENGLDVVDILASENKSVIPITNMFGFNFVTKIVSAMNLEGSMPNADQPFGNIMPMLIWSSILGDDKDGKSDFFGEMDFGKLMMLSMMSGASNPLAGIMNLGGMFGSTTATAATQE